MSIRHHNSEGACRPSSPPHDVLDSHGVTLPPAAAAARPSPALVRLTPSSAADSRGRPHSPAQLNSGREDHLR